MKRPLTALLLLAVLVVPARSTTSEEAAEQSAARISAYLDQVIRDAEMLRAMRRASEARGIRVSKDGVLFLDGAEVPFDEMQWVESASKRRTRRAADTDTLLRVGPGMSLSLTNHNGDIRVIPWDRNEVRVQAEHGDEDRVVVVVRNDVVRLGVGANSSSGEVDWTLTVPDWLPLELVGMESEISVSGMKSAVSAKNMRGDVTVNGCQGALEVNSVEGEVHVSDVLGAVSAGSINSIVRIVRVTGPVEAQTINGDIQLVKVESPNVDASTVNGRVYYASKYQPRGRYMFSSHNGKIMVPMPGHQDVKVSMSSFQGQVESSIPIPKPARAPRARGQHFRFVMQDGVILLDPPASPEAPTAPTAPPTPSTPRTSRPPRPVRTPIAPEIELESFNGLIRLVSEEEVVNLLALHREAQASRRAALDSARVYQLRSRGEIERARRLEQSAKERETERRRAPRAAPAPPATPETPPPSKID